MQTDNLLTVCVFFATLMAHFSQSTHNNGNETVNILESRETDREERLRVNEEKVTKMQLKDSLR